MEFLLYLFSELINASLYEVDDYEACSLVFLLLDIEHLAGQGFKYCQHISNGRIKVRRRVLCSVSPCSFCQLMKATFESERNFILELINSDRNLFRGYCYYIPDC